MRAQWALRSLSCQATVPACATRPLPDEQQGPSESSDYCSALVPVPRALTQLEGMWSLSSVALQCWPCKVHPSLGRCFAAGAGTAQSKALVIVFRDLEDVAACLEIKQLQEIEGAQLPTVSGGAAQRPGGSKPTSHSAATHWGISQDVPTSHSLEPPINTPPSLAWALHPPWFIQSHVPPGAVLAGRCCASCRSSAWGCRAAVR